LFITEADKNSNDMKYNLFEINERLQNKEITPEQARKELLNLFDVVGTFFCEDEDLKYTSKKCKEQCDGCKWIENL
jgi:hypothetical protein